MALGISYSPQFFDSLEEILNFFDERNGSISLHSLLENLTRWVNFLATQQ